MSATALGVAVGPEALSLARPADEGGVFWHATGVTAGQNEAPAAMTEPVRASTDAWSVLEIVDALDGRALLPLGATYRPPVTLIGTLLTSARADALAAQAAGPLTLALPSRWASDRNPQPLRDAAGAAGFADVEVVAAAEAAAWAPILGPPAGPGVLVVLELGPRGMVTALESDVSGMRVLDAASLDRHDNVGDVVRHVLGRVHRTLSQLRDVRAVGAEATDRGRIAAIAADLGGPIRVPADPGSAVAIGAAHRRRGAGAASDAPNMIVRLHRFADSCPDRARAIRAQELAQALHDYRLGTHPGSADPIAGRRAVEREAEQLLESAIYSGRPT